MPRQVNAVVWHDMQGFLAGALSRFNDPNSQASAHLGLLQDGTVVRFRPFEDVTFHAGTDNDPNGGIYGRTPFWRSNNINPHSIGVELEGFLDKGYTPAQAAAVRRVADWLAAHYPIPRQHTFDQLAGHHAHSELSSSRSDPGPRFDWSWVL